MEYKSFPVQWFELNNFVIQYAGVFPPDQLTFYLDLEAVRLRVPLEVAGHAGVDPGLGPGHTLQHQAGAADEDTLLYILVHSLVLKKCRNSLST